MTAYYNEIDPYAAQWLRNLIAAGLIAPGDVDERSIEDVRPDDLAGYRQCHFFAGIGVWSYALRRAGWPDDREVWTGSCPCQPFSTAGEGDGFADERHLWPAFFHLISQRRPATIAGEQVAGKDAEPWIDLVCADLGSLGYASGAVAFPSASVGAPHIRDRLYWKAHASRSGSPEQRRGWQQPARPAAVGFAGDMADADEGKCGRLADGEGRHPHWTAAGRQQSNGELASGGELCELAGTQGRRCGQGSADPSRGNEGTGPERAWRGSADVGSGDRPGPVNGFWRGADWLLCRDGRWRPVEGGTFPLAHGDTTRVGRLRAYGNAINAEAARVFCECLMEAA